MTIDPQFIGKIYPEQRYEIGAAKIREFCKAIKADCEKFAKIAPPTFPVVYSAEFLAAILYDPELKLNLRKLVHGEQEFTYHKPVQADDTITSSGRIEKIFSKGAHDFVVSKVESINQRGELVCDSVWTFIVRGGNGSDFSAKEKLMMKIASLMPSEETKRLNQARKIFGANLCPISDSKPVYRTNPDGTSQLEVFIDKYMPQKYAGASGDFNAIHLDDALGKSVGLGGYILHGMATMAMGANLAMQGKAADSVRKYRVRFSAPVKPFDVLTYTGKASDSGKEFAFKAKNQNGQEVLNTCLVEFN